MKINYFLLETEIAHLLVALHQQKVIAYPTESVFGLGCDPDSEIAVKTLLTIKQRSWQKGLILVAAHYDQLTKYINNNMLSDTVKSRIFNLWPGPITWVVPAHTTTPRWLMGQFSSLAVRVSDFEPLRRLCLAFGKPLVSTSANLTGQLPARTASEVRNKLGSTFPIMERAVGRQLNPSEIRNALNNNLIRLR